MATYYIDPTLGSDSNAGTSEGAPWATIGKITTASAWVAGNTFLLRRGRTFTEKIQVGTNGSVASPITISNYGLISDDLPKIRPSGADDWGVDLKGYAGIVVDGLDVKPTGNGTAIWFGVYQSGANVLPTIIRNNRVTGTDSGGGAGIQGYIGRGFNSAVIDTWTQTPGPVLIENNYVYRTGDLGIGFGDYQNVTIRGNTVVECCLRVDQIGIIVSQTNNATLLTWTVHAGNIYKTTITTAMRGELRGLSGCDAVRLTFPSTDVWSLRENTAVAVGSLATGEYQISAGVLYGNFGGVDPNTATVSSISFAGVRNWIVEDNIVLDTFKVSSEGVGIQADAFAGNGIIRRNYVRTNNGQPGIAANDARSVTIVGNVVENVASGAGGGLAFSDSYQGAGPVVCENNTAIVNGQVADSAAFNFGGTKAGGSFKFNNNIVKGACNVGLGFYSPDSSSVVEWKNNCYFGPQGSKTVYNATVTESGTVTTDPALNSQFMPMASAVRTAGTGGGGGDYYGNEFKYTPTIGAVQYEAERTLVSRTVAAGTVATRTLAAKRKVTA